MADADALLAELNAPVRRSFCVLPWIHRFTNLGGEVQLCCTAEDQPGSHLVTDDGTPIRVGDALGEDAIANCASLRRVRRAMLAGEWPDACARCLAAERAGSPSRRTHENALHAADIPRLLAETTADGVAPVRVTSRDYRFGNLCNLRCRMCHPRASLPLLPEFVAARPGEFSDAELEATRHYAWFRTPGFWDDFRRHCRTLGHLHFAGGEPLVIPEVARALDVCIEEGCASRIVLTFNTNATKLPRAMLERWPHFRGVVLALSLDGVGAVNDYIRHPARWATIERNLRVIDDEHARLNVTAAWVNTTVQVYNLLGLPDLVKYLHAGFRFIHPIPSLAPLTSPEYFDVRILPRALKREATRRLTALRAELAGRGTEAPEQIDGILAHLHGRRASPLRCADFRRVTAAFDRLRGQTLSDVAPELTPLMAPDGLSATAARFVEQGRNRLGRSAAVRHVRALVARSGLPLRS
ncbi:MAG: radical SAM protein [bacterium]|nr:radical SAM protein [bacterium]